MQVPLKGVWQVFDDRLQAMPQPAQKTI